MKRTKVRDTQRYAQPMTTEQLSHTDKKELMAGLKASVILVLFIMLAVAVVLAIILGIATLIFGQPADGIGQRLLVFLAFTSFVFVHPFLISIDLILGKKKIITTSDFNLFEKKKKHYIKIKDNRPNPKIQIDEELAARIDTAKPFTMERTLISKTLLFASHDKNNLLKVIEDEMTELIEKEQAGQNIN